MPTTNKVPLHDIDPPPNPMRFEMDEKKMQELMDSFVLVGQLQPIGVYPLEGRLAIEYGHRRYVAAERLGWREIECKVFTQEEIKNGAAMLAENVEREDVTEAEEAVMFAEAQEKYGLDEEGLVARFKKGKNYIADRLALLRNDQDVFKALQERKINFSVARELNKVKDKGYRRYYLDAAIRGGATARAVMGWRQQLEAQVPPDQNTPVAQEPVADAPPSTENPLACVICGGHKDPWNMVSVYIHKYELEQILKVIQQTAEAN